MASFSCLLLPFVSSNLPWISLSFRCFVLLSVIQNNLIHRILSNMNIKKARNLHGILPKILRSHAHWYLHLFSSTSFSKILNLSSMLIMYTNLPTSIEGWFSESFTSYSLYNFLSIPNLYILYYLKFHFVLSITDIISFQDHPFFLINLLSFAFGSMGSCVWWNTTFLRLFYRVWLWFTIFFPRVSSFTLLTPLQNMKFWLLLMKSPLIVSCL